MIQVIKFQSKPNKNRKYEYTLQKNGMYKSNGSQGSEFSSAYFNNLNPVLEVKSSSGTTFKIGDRTAQSGRIVSMILTADKQDVQITGDTKVPGYKNVLVSNAIKTTSSPATPEKPKVPEVKPFNSEAAKTYVKEHYALEDSDGNDLQQEDLPTCCGLIEVGNFPSDKDIISDIEGHIENFTSKSSYKDKKPLKKDITSISNDEEFISELVVNSLEKELNLNKSFIAVLNNKDQSYVLKAFEEMSTLDKHKGSFDMIEFKSNLSGNKLTLITYTIG